jgi:glycosyltransferase involved in cell wall biosynthesis/mannosyltransferase OCH1-like enzyme
LGILRLSLLKFSGAMSTTISLVMTVYNTQYYLSQALDSILAQTYPHWELILWDDGSTDASPQIASAYASRDRRIQFIAAPHTGRIQALHDAILVAPHSYLAFVDSDDLLAENALAATVEILDRHPAVGVVYTDYMTIDTQGQIQGVGARCQIPYSKDRLLVDFLMFQFRLLRREIYELVGGIDTNFRSAEDYDLCLKLSEVTEIYHLQQPLYYYRKHPQSISHIGKQEQIEYSGKAVQNALDRRGLADLYQFNILPTGQFQLQRLPDPVAPSIPKIIHQTWKDRHLPPHLAAFQRTWQEHHPDWEYRLWTDADNRAFLAQHYPWFLPIYDGYAHFICRVDAIRYFWLHHYGGMYVDLDFECLAPIDSLLVDRSICLSLEPAEHTVENDRAKADNLAEILSPAWMASTAHHPFWQHLWEHLKANRAQPDPLSATGPFLLTCAYQTYVQAAEITLIPADRLHPITLTQNSHGQLFDLAVRQQIAPTALAIHHWHGSWWSQNAGAKSGSEIADADVLILDRGRELIQAKLNCQIDRSIAPTANSHPKISCLMVTKNRAHLAKRAIFCFLQQTYPNKELVIIDDGENNDLAEFMRQFPEPQICYYRLPSAQLSLGELRNTSVAKATGAYLAQWDDDDLSDPSRLEVQMHVIQSFRVDGCLLDSLYVWWPQLQRLAKSFRRTWEGTLICRKDIFPSYPSVRRGEDTEVVDPLIQNYRIAALTRPELYLYCFHQNNTWELKHFDRHWQSAQSKFEDRDYIIAIQKFAARLPIHSYLQSFQNNPIQSTVDLRSSASNNLKTGINVAGLIDEGFGISEGMKYCLSALTADQIPHVINQIEVKR